MSGASRPPLKPGIPGRSTGVLRARATLAEFPMTKLQDARVEELSEPEISVGAAIQARAEEFKGNIIGERFGKYLLVGEIAVGGMAEVFLAVHKGVEGF